MIPKIIYFYWDSETIHDVLQDNINFIKKQNKDHLVKVISPNDFIKLLEVNKPELLFYFNKLNKNLPALRADYVKYVLLYLYGGVYIDIKSRPKKPLDNLYKNIDLLLIKEELTKPHICNSFLVSKPKHIFFKKVIEKCNYNIDNYHTFNININSPKSNVIRLFGTCMIGEVVNNNLSLFNNKNNILIPSKYYSKYIIFSIVNKTNRRYSKDHYELYTKKHYTKVKEHLVI